MLAFWETQFSQGFFSQWINECAHKCANKAYAIFSAPDYSDTIISDFFALSTLPLLTEYSAFFGVGVLFVFAVPLRSRANLWHIYKATNKAPKFLAENEIKWSWLKKFFIENFISSKIVLFENLLTGLRWSRFSAKNFDATSWNLFRRHIYESYRGLRKQIQNFMVQIHLYEKYAEDYFRIEDTSDSNN